MHFGCSDDLNKAYVYEPIENVRFEIELKSIEGRQDTKSKFLFITCKIDNGSDNQIFFNYSEIKANLNNFENTFTYYDSLASSEAEREMLNPGETVYNLYLVYPYSLDTKKIEKFEITNFGLTNNKKAGV